MTTGSKPIEGELRCTAGQLASGPPAFIYWSCNCGWNSAGYDPDHPASRRSAYQEFLRHREDTRALTKATDTDGGGVR